jgi:hypothetical protein
MIEKNRAEIPDNTEFQRLLAQMSANMTQQIMFVHCNGVGTFRIKKYRSAANAVLGFDLRNAAGTVLLGSPALETELTLAEFDGAVGYTGEALTLEERVTALEDA